MRPFPVAALAAAILVPAVAVAQARNGNVYDGTAHQPTAGVQQNERAAGVAPSQQTIQNQNADLDSMGRKLLNDARQNAHADPSAARNVYGVQPGGVVDTRPKPGLTGGVASGTR